MIDRRTNWSRHIDQILRSKHYTWLAEGLAGEPLENALCEILTDIRHICRREDISWPKLLEQSGRQFEQEEMELREAVTESTDECTS